MQIATLTKTLALGVPLVLAACGKSSAPKCDSAKLEAALSRLIVHPAALNGDYADVIGYDMWVHVEQSRTGPIVVIADIDGSVLDKSLTLTFRDERERSYNQETEKRACTANIDGSIDPSFFRGAIKVRPVARQLTGQEASAHANTPQQNMDFGDQLWKSDGPDVPLTAEQMKEAQSVFEQSAGGMVRATRTWRDPQNYTVQVTEKGALYVTLE